MQNLITMHTYGIHTSAATSSIKMSKFLRNTMREGDTVFLVHGTQFVRLTASRNSLKTAIAPEGRAMTVALTPVTSSILYRYFGQKKFSHQR